MAALALVLATGVAAASSTLGRVLAGVLSMVPVALALRQARVAVVLTEDAVIVRNVFRTHRLPWQDIASVRPSTAFGYGVARRTGAIFTLRSGQEISADAYVRAAWDRAIGSDMVDAVSARLGTPAVSD